MKHLALTLLTGALFFSSCQSNKSDQSADNQQEQQTSELVDGFVFQPAFTDLTWTAYKTNDRKPVSGTFKEMEIVPGKASGSVADILNGLTFSMATSSVFSDDASRDSKLMATFFGSMNSTSSITGKVNSVEGDDNSGTAMIAITMNGVEHETKANYTRTDQVVSLETSLELSDWNAIPSVEALNKVCELLHTGDDGKSKLWSDITVVVKSTLKGDAPAS